MRKIWVGLGQIAGWLTWPLVWLVIRFTTRARVLIICHGEMLLLKGWLSIGQWGLPGGGVRKGETAIQAVIRETEEEIGVRLDQQPLRALGKFRQTKGHGYSFEGFAVELKAKPQLHIRKSEITEATWIKLSAMSTKTAEQHVELLLTAWQKQR